MVQLGQQSRHSARDHGVPGAGPVRPDPAAQHRLPPLGRRWQLHRLNGRSMGPDRQEVGCTGAPDGDTAKDFLNLVRPSNGNCNILMQERWTNPVVDFVRYHLMDIRLFDVLWQRGVRMAGLAGMGKGQRGISTVDP